MVIQKSTNGEKLNLEKASVMRNCQTVRWVENGKLLAFCGRATGIRAISRGWNPSLFLRIIFYSNVYIIRSEYFRNLIIEIGFFYKPVVKG